MKNSKYSEAQIGMVLWQMEADSPIAEVIRNLSVNKQTYYLWRKKYEQVFQN